MIALAVLGLMVQGKVNAAPAWMPRCCVPAPSYLDSPPATSGTDQGLPGSPNVSPEQFNLGEGAPAQTGDTFAMNAPNMIGDLLSNSGFIFDQIGGPGGPSEHVYSTIAIAGGDRRFKISENMSPLPRDRVYYAFNGFQQASRTVDNRVLDVNRHTFGGEKTFWNGGGSIEFRMPVLQGLSAIQSLDSNLQNDDGVEFGNSTLIPKFILNEGPDYVLSLGMGINLPTARDASIFGAANPQQPFLSIQNEAVYLSPFLGLLWLPMDDTYVMSYLQLDFATGGNTVLDGAGNSLGSLQDQNLLHFDVSVGRFLYRDSNTRLTGIAAQVEFHYTTTVQDSQLLAVPLGNLGNPFNRLDLLILTGGFNFEFWNSSWLTIGCAVPLRGIQDPLTRQHPERPFDAEIQVLFNRYF